MAVSEVQSTVVNADSELEKVLNIARHIGVTSGDEVNISYTSLLIGLMWSDDPTSTWIRQQLDSLGVHKSAIYANRKIDESLQAAIVNKVISGQSVSPGRDETSTSARTVLNEAQSLAIESGLPPNMPPGTRHIAAVYFFRNPPAHVRRFTQWGFDKEAWRRGFANLITFQYPREAPGWAQILAGYFPSELSRHDVKQLSLYSVKLRCYSCTSISSRRGAHEIPGVPVRCRGRFLHHPGIRYPSAARRNVVL